MSSDRRGRQHPGAPSSSRPSPWRLTIVVTLSSVVFLVGCAAFLARWSWQPADDGARWRDTPAGVVAETIDPGAAAERAGLQVGDRLLAIGGSTVATALDAEARMRSAEPGASLPITIERDGLKRVLDLRADAAPDDRHLYTYLSLVGLLSLVLGTVLAARVSLGPVRVPYYLLSVATFIVFVFSHSGRADRLDWVIYWGDAGGRLLLVAAFLHFVLTFTRSGRSLRSAAILLYAPLLILLVVEAWLVGARGLYRFADPVQVLDRLHRWQLGAMTIGLGSGIVSLAVVYLRATRDRLRRPLKWLFWGGAVGFGPFLVLYLFPTALGLSLPGWSDLSALPLMLVPLCFAAAVARYRLTDLELFFKRGLSTAVLAACSVGIYLAGDLILRRVFPAGPAGLSQVLAVILAAALLPRTRNLVHAAVDRLFYQERYDPRRSVFEFGRDLNRERELGPLVEKLVQRVERTLGVERVSVLVSDPEAGTCAERVDGGLVLELDSPLARALERGGSLDLDDIGDPRAEAAPAGRFEQAGMRYLVALTVQGRLVGLLALGERRDGSPLHSEDRQLLEAVAGHAAVAVEGARLFEEMGRRAREIERLKDFNEEILESSQVGVLVVEEGDRIAGWNRTLAQITGTPRQEAMGQSLTTLFGEPFAEVLRQGIAASGEAGVRRYREWLPGSGSGPSRLVNLGFSPLRLPAGTSWVVTFDDITDGARREQILIQQERLASIGLLASGVAHEVNTPLTGISSYAQMLLQDTPEDDPRYPLLQKIEKQSFRAADIARRLLNFSRPDHQGFVEVDCNELLEETLSLLEPQIRGRKVFVHRELAEDLPAIRGHRGKLQQVLLNLLLNARDAMPRGGEIRVRTAADGDRVLIEVRDTGEGIRPEVLGRIYDPFFTTKAPGQGTGLGLSITYGIVREHDGSIGVESTVGEGTRFQVRLPVLPPLRAAADG